MASLYRALRPAAAVRRQIIVPFARCAASSKGPVHIEHEHNRDLDVGELQGAKFKIEPLRRTGEDEHTMRARLLYQSRKRGILESDLLMSTFANAMLPTMSKQQMVQYDLFLDENDWDIYYWATQDESPGPDTTPTNPPKAKSLESSTTAGAESYHGVGAGAEKTIDAGTSGNADPPVPQDVQVRVRKDGEWAQTIGTFKPAYRPVPARWKDSEILLMLREHVRSRRADTDATGEGRGRETPAAEAGKGMGFMPPLFEMKR